MNPNHGSSCVIVISTNQVSPHACLIISITVRHCNSCTPNTLDESAVAKDPFILMLRHQDSNRAGLWVRAGEGGSHTAL